MASPIEDVSGLPGEKVSDQEGHRIGKVKEIYGIGGEKDPMWVTIETSTGFGADRIVFVPLARLKHERGEVRVPYSFQHIQASPEIDATDELSDQDDEALRAYYAIGMGDQEVRTDNESYANRVPNEEGPSTRL